MCADFLWSGSPTNYRASKLAWHDVCKPKDACGLGIRSFEDTSKVFSLSIIWRLISDTRSLWATWIHRYLIRGSTFWDVSVGTNGSWLWRKLLQSRPLAASYLRFDIGNGYRTSFWFDNWTSLGHLFNLTGERGIREFGITRYSCVADAVSSLGWHIRRPQLHSLRTIHDRLLTLTPPHPQAGADTILWKHGPDPYRPSFSSSKTWSQLSPSYPKHSWFSTIWFPRSISRYAFISWLAVLDRLQTGRRMRIWGITQPCILCGEPEETRDHLFFACPYSFTLWSDLTMPLLRHRLSPDWAVTLTSLRQSSLSTTDRVLLRMSFQAAIYHI